MSNVLTTTLTFTIGNPTVTVTGGGSVVNFVSGDLIHTIGRLPIPILSTTTGVITLTENAAFNAADEPSFISATNARLRDFFDEVTTLSDGYTSWFVGMEAWTTTLGTISVTGPNGSTTVDTLPKILQDITLQTAEVQTNLGLLSAVPALVTEAQNWVNTPVDVQVPEGAASDRSALHYHTKIVTLHSDADGWHTAMDEWQSTVGTQHGDVQGWYPLISDWHTDVDGWQQSANTSAINAGDSETLAQQYANQPEDMYVDGTTEYSAFHWKEKTQALGSGTAPDSLKLGDELPSFYATASSVNSVASTDVENSFTVPQNITGAGTAVLTLTKSSANTAVGISFQDELGEVRWELYEGNTAGVDLILRARDSAGATIGKVLTVDNAARVVDFEVAPTISGSPIFYPGNLPEISAVNGLQEKLDEIELFALAGL